MICRLHGAVPGDMIRDADLGELRVGSVELDTTPHLVRNLEVAGAHTYFAGDLGAWGHNAGVYGWIFGKGKQYWGRTFGGSVCKRANASKSQRTGENGRPPSVGLKWNASGELEAAVWERFLIRQAQEGGCSLNNANMPGIPKRFRK